MSNLHNRVKQLEKQQPQPEQPREYPPGYYERAMQALADALTDITGQATTPDEVTEALRHEHRTTTQSH